MYSSAAIAPETHSHLFFIFILPSPYRSLLPFSFPPNPSLFYPKPTPYPFQWGFGNENCLAIVWMLVHFLFAALFLCWGSTSNLFQSDFIQKQFALVIACCISCSKYWCKTSSIRSSYKRSAVHVRTNYPHFTYTFVLSDRQHVQIFRRSAIPSASNPNGNRSLVQCRQASPPTVEQTIRCRRHMSRGGAVNWHCNLPLKLPASVSLWDDRL